ncbi:MAG: ATP-binding protein [Clostridia bacterium]|nr:ATP-binding protein [Clostridia bacterium]
MREIDLPPYAPLLMESTRALGYSLEAAIADLLDNSITAGALNINIEFWPYDNSYLSILDDGTGMSPVELTNAMRYGSRNPNEKRGTNDLGRFGLGLKTASLSQCRILTVVSLKDGILSGRRWDLDYVIDTGEWTLLALDEEEIAPLPQVKELMEQGKGTIVVWQSLDRLSAGEASFEQGFGEKIDYVREHLALVFHRYLTGEPGTKKTQMSINNNLITPHDPFLTLKSVQIMDDEYIHIDNEKVVVKPFILPHVSKMTESEIKSLGGDEGLRRRQGFYVYRNKRLLVWGTWFKLMRQDDLSKLARVRVDIPNSLDHLWTLDIRKSTAVPPEIVKRNLKRIIGLIAQSSKRTYTFRGRKETTDEVVHIWNRYQTREGIRYGINRDYPLVDFLKVKLDQQGKNYLEQLLMIAEINLPLNSLYIDLTNDEKFSSDEDRVVKDNLRNLIKSVVESSGSDDERNTIFENLKCVEPFSQYPELIDEIKGEY